MMRATAFVLFGGLAGCAAQQARPDYDAVSQRLDRSRAELTPPLSATTHSLERRRMVEQPGGENRFVAGLLAQLPGVTVGPSGQVRVRGQ